MTPEQTAGAFAIVGVVVGSGMTALIEFARRRGEDRRARRTELRDLVAAFWADTDDLWTAAVALTATLPGMPNTGVDVLERAYRKRRAAANERERILRVAQQRLAVLRLTFPTLAVAATELVRCSQSYARPGDNERADSLANRERALQAFESAARDALRL